ncbi:MAG: hypothetical protein DHS20C15_18520 [Planctomycetota bacterium]|nr:MAG: hypothetical protein DHS20C15_18520 [Planctomycetota bacterium]
MASQLALDYGAHRVRLMEFDGSARKLRVLKVVDVDLRVAASDDEDSEPGDLKAELVGNAADKARLTVEPSVMTLDAGSALFREFDLPFTNDDQINKVVRFEAESHIPLDVDDVVQHHHVLRKSREKSHILTVAVKKDELLDRLDILEAADIDPMLVDLDVFALFNALKVTGVADEAGVQVVLDLREDATSVLFLVDAELFAVRQLRLGLHGIVGGDELGASAAERMEGDAIEARSHDFLTKLKRELRRTLTTLPNLGDVESVHLCGSGAAVKGLPEAAEELFKVRATPLNLLERVDHKLSNEEVALYGPDIGVALGAAYKLLGSDALRADFRQDECAYTRKFDQVKSPLIALSFLLFLVVALTGIDTYKRRDRVLEDFRAIFEQAEVQVGDLAEMTKEELSVVWRGFDSMPDQVRALHSHVDTMRDDREQTLGRGEKIPALPSALAVWIQFSDLVLANEEELGRFWMSRLDISVDGNRPSLKVAGTLESAKLYNHLINMLEEDALFVEVTPGGTQPTDEGFTQFSETVASIDLEVLQERVRSALEKSL